MDSVLVEMGGERVPVGGEVQAFVLLLQLHPVLERAVVVADVHPAGRAHAREHAVVEHVHKPEGSSRLSSDLVSTPATIGCINQPRTPVASSAMTIMKPYGSSARIAHRHRVRQQADRDAAAVERKNRQEVQRHQHQVDLYSCARHFRASRRWPERLRRRRVLEQQCPARPPSRNWRPVRAGDPEHVPLRVAQVAEIDRHRLRPPENERGPPNFASSNSIPGTRIVPTGSICLIGFAVTRPSIQAVWSPNSLAT